MQTKGLPEKMMAIACDGAGGPEVLVSADLAVPVPGPGQVLIKVAFAGVNRPDIVQREGRYPPPPGAPDTPGLEIAGTVVAVGDGVGQDLIGLDQCALVAGGGYAEYCLAQAAHCLPVPAGFPLDAAAAMPETLFTVWHNLFELGLAGDGERALIHGGTSGIGSMAIKLCSLFGVKAYVTCGSDAKCEAAKALGASVAINYKHKDFVEEIRNLTDGSGVDVVLDMVSGDYVSRNIDCMAKGGRHVTIAILGGTRATIPMHKVMMNRLTLTGSTLRPRSDAFKAALAEEIRGTVWPFVEAGQLTPEIDATFPLAAAAAAHAHLEKGDHVGKVVLQVG